MLDTRNGRAPPRAAPRWLKCFKPNPTAKWRMICFPFAGGGANFYRRWPEFFPANVEIHAVQLPGREMRLHEPSAHSADAIGNCVIEELKTFGCHIPVVFFGHSMGSMLAYDIARKLKQHQGAPRLLIASGRQPPHLCADSDFHRQPDDVFIAEIKRLNGTPEGVLEDEEMRRIVLPMLRGDYTVLGTYRLPVPEPLACPIVTCVGNKDSEVTPEEMKAWETLTRSACLHRVFAGDHFFLRDRLPELAGFLNECLMRFASTAPGGFARAPIMSERT